MRNGVLFGRLIPRTNPGQALCELPRTWKQRILVGFDAGCVFLAFWSAYALRLNELWPDRIFHALPLMAALPFVAVAVLWRFGAYRTLLRSLERRSAWRLLQACAIVAMIAAAADFLAPQLDVPRSVPIIFALVLGALLLGGRHAGQSLFHRLRRTSGRLEPVLVYGAGEAGRQLAASLDLGSEYDVVGFLDDDKALQGNQIGGRRVHGPAEITELSRRHAVGRVLLALPSISIGRRREILMLLSKHGMSVKTVPAIPEIVSGRVGVEALRDVSLGDLLGRDQVAPRQDLLSTVVTGQVVMVSGAGGSIGGELCRQIVTLLPKRVVLLESNEAALHAIHHELLDLSGGAGSEIPVHAVLGSVCDDGLVERTLSRFGVDTVYHAAAFKHVPMLEENVIEGLRNNVLGTHCVARKAGEAGAKRFILVSTDKAVRPTNVMGASKRWAEQICQASQSRFPETTYSMVRFGNVLGSSGSVIPRFAQQIRQGGPVTVTHPEIYRYFMSIEEAAQLVIHAGALAEGGEVFVLDMGEPLRIADLARHMIALHGLRVKDEEAPDGDIEIIYTGLRAGEKLYEELLTGNDPMETGHPKIWQAREAHASMETLEASLKKLQAAILARDNKKAISLLSKVVPEYVPRLPGVGPHDREGDLPLSPGAQPIRPGSAVPAE